MVEYSEVADSIHARTCSNKNTADMDGRGARQRRALARRRLSHWIGPEFHEFQEGCTFKSSEGCALVKELPDIQSSQLQNLAYERTIQTCNQTYAHTRTHTRTRVCKPLSYDIRGYAHLSKRPRNSGPIQWARSGVGLKPSAAARPRCSPEDVYYRLGLVHRCLYVRVT